MFGKQVERTLIKIIGKKIIIKCSNCQHSHCCNKWPQLLPVLLKECMAWSSIHELRLPQELNVIKINQKPINVVVNQSARSLYHKLSIILFPRRTKCQPSCGRRCFGGRTSSRCHRSGTEISSIRTRWAREF